MKKNEYEYNDIVYALKNVGLEKGDSVFIHSNLGFFGKMKDATVSDDYNNFFKNAIFEIIGENGTLITPTFSFSFCNSKKFDVEQTPGVCGMFSEFIRKNNMSMRSNDPNFSISAIGKYAKFFTENCSSHSFGQSSFWERFLTKKGKICNFNFDSASTLFHHIEKILNVSYRFDKKFQGELKIGDKFVEKEFKHFVYNKNKPEHAPNFEKFHNKAMKLKKVKISNLGRGQITCITAEDTLEIIKNEIVIQPNFLITGDIE